MSAKVSLIIATYDWPEALDLVLDSAARQTWPDLEVIVADDGSGVDTRRLVAGWSRRMAHPVQQVWQPDGGFRLAQSRNRAIERATGDYLIMVDGDCLMFPDFVRSHMRWAERGWFASGKRCFLRKGLSKRVLDRKLPLHSWPKSALFPLLLLGGGTRAAQLLPLPQTDAARRSRAQDWRQAQGCNLACWRDDFIDVGGFDERFQAWGGEDTDFVLRLLKAGVRRLTLQHEDPVLHLWHPRRAAVEVEAETLRRA